MGSVRCEDYVSLIVENFVSIIPLTSRICSEVISFRHAVKGIYLAIPLNESISFFSFQILIVTKYLYCQQYTG